MLNWLFKKKKKELEELDEFSDDSYKLDLALITVVNICNKYEEKGLAMLLHQAGRQMGEIILQRGLRR